jgi:hypothetical protein
LSQLLLVLSDLCLEGGDLLFVGADFDGVGVELLFEGVVLCGVKVELLSKIGQLIAGSSCMCFHLCNSLFECNNLIPILSDLDLLVLICGLVLLQLTLQCIDLLEVVGLLMLELLKLGFVAECGCFYGVSLFFEPCQFFRKGRDFFIGVFKS